MTTNGGFGHLQKGHGVALADLDKMAPDLRRDGIYVARIGIDWFYNQDESE